MFNSNNGYSLADIAAATGENNNGFGTGNGAWWVVLLFIICIAGGWNGNGFGNNGGAGTNFMNSLNTDYLSGSLRDLQSSLASNFLTLNNENLSGFCDVQRAIADNGAAITSAVTNGFNTQNLANLQNSNAIQRDIYANTVGGMQNTQALQATLAQMASDQRADTAQIAYNQATNACAINTNAANNTRDIIDAMNAGNRAILDAMAQNKVDAMQDKINTLQDQLQTANFLASQAAQNSYLIDQLKPSPQPAYVVANPNGCNCRYNTMAMNMVNA